MFHIQERKRASPVDLLIIFYFSSVKTLIRWIPRGDYINTANAQEFSCLKNGEITFLVSYCCPYVSCVPKCICLDQRESWSSSSSCWKSSVGEKHALQCSNIRDQKQTRLSYFNAVTPVVMLPPFERASPKKRDSFLSQQRLSWKVWLPNTQKKISSPCRTMDTSSMINTGVDKKSYFFFALPHLSSIFLCQTDFTYILTQPKRLLLQKHWTSKNLLESEGLDLGLSTGSEQGFLCLRLYPLQNWHGGTFIRTGPFSSPGLLDPQSAQSANLKRVTTQSPKVDFSFHHLGMDAIKSDTFWVQSNLHSEQLTKKTLQKSQDFGVWLYLQSLFLWKISKNKKMLNISVMVNLVRLLVNILPRLQLSETEENSKQLQKDQ